MVAGEDQVVVGVERLEVAARLLPADSFFKRPGVDLWVAIQATLLLIVAGTLAGFFPARRAGRLRPVEALRNE